MEEEISAFLPSMPHPWQGHNGSSWLCTVQVKGEDGCDPSTLTLPPLGLACGGLQEHEGGEYELLGLELLWQQETGMSGPHL